MAKDPLYTEADIRNLRVALDHKVTDETTLSWLYLGLLDARSRHLALHDLHSPGSHKDARHSVQRLDRALTKLGNGKGTTAAAHRSLKAAVADLKRYAPGALTELDANGLILLPVPELIGPDFKRISVFEQLVERVLAGDADSLHHLKGATRQFLDNTRSPGRGGARRDARRHRFGIERLAEYFSELFPDRKVSADPNSLFFLYAKFWINNFMGSTVKNPELHIQHAIDEINGKTFL